MKSKLLFMIILFFTSITLIAQEIKEKEKFGYSNITEFGAMVASPRGYAFEATTAQGFSINKKHHFGIGIGIGVNSNINYLADLIFYMPTFINYRIYLKPERKFTHHFNMALGGVFLRDGGGAYSSICFGFKVGKFSFSQGLSFFALQILETWGETIFNPNPNWEAGEFYMKYVERSAKKWYFPVGITLKWGFAN